MPTVIPYALAYLVPTFILGAGWHMVLFKDYYKKLAIYSNIENPRFSFGMTAMALQGIVAGYAYPLVGNAWVFALGLFMALISFAVFTEAAKQKATSLSGFVCIQTVFSAVQTAIVSLALLLVSRAI